MHFLLNKFFPFQTRYLVFIKKYSHCLDPSIGKPCVCSLPSNIKELEDCMHFTVFCYCLLVLPFPLSSSTSCSQFLGTWKPNMYLIECLICLILDGFTAEMSCLDVLTYLLRCFLLKSKSDKVRQTDCRAEI